MNFTEYIFEHSMDFGRKNAIFYKQDSISYSGLHRLIQRIMKRLEQLDFGTHEKIMIVSDNSFFFVASYFAIIGSGNVAVPLHKDFGKENFDYVRETCNIKCFFIQKKYIKKIHDYGIRTEILFTDECLDSNINIFDLNNEFGTIREVDAQKDVAVIIFTSGSTGVPKGVMQSHHSIAYNTESIIQYLKLNANDRMMAVLPFSYCFGTSLLHTHFRVGGQIVLNNLFMFPGKVLKEINERECTGFAGVPSTYQILLRRSALKKMTFPTLRLVQQAGGKLSRKFISELIDALPTTKIFIMYGQTEATARLSYLPPKLLDKKLGSIGKGIPGTTLEVLNKNNIPVGPGEIGEVVASGGNIMLGYWNDPEETAKAIRNGKLYTGDIGTVDEDGFIFLTDREKDFVKSGGFRVSPKEIENYISNLEDVVEVAIIGVPDELYGEALKVFASIKSKSNLKPSDVIEFCKKNFPPHKVPREVEFMKSLPKNNSSKIDKPTLRIFEKKRKI